MRVSSLITLSLLLFLTRDAYAQQQEAPEVRKYNFASPLNIPMYLSGNYGELRSNHFHSGIDIKTQGVIGKPVFALESGYVSRIVVSPSGFGKAIYVNHPNGTTTLYGHVERFNNEIDNYVYEMQYQRKSFAVELYPTKDKFPVKKGERIAYSGNRGSSGGPHLHLEVRDAATQVPINILSHKLLKIEDTAPPRFATLYFVSIDTVHGVPVHTIRERRSVKRTSTGGYLLSDTTALKLRGSGYFAVEIAETKNGAANPLGIYSIDVLVDGKNIFGMTMDSIPFSQARYAYAVSLHPESKGKSNGIYRLYRMPNNPLSIYSKSSDGIVSRSKISRNSHVKIVVGDDCSNFSDLNFNIVADSRPYSPVIMKGTPANWSERFRYNQNGLHFFIPNKSLYNSTFIDITATKPSDKLNGYSPLYAITPAHEVLQDYMTISIDADSLPEHLRGKAIIGSVSPNGMRSSIGGKWQKSDKDGGEVSARIRNFGNFYITVDTVSPRITPSFNSGVNMQNVKSLSFVISDDLSGIDSYTATIDDKWALFEYDPKSRRITHFFDDEKWPKGATHTIKLEVKDAKGNSKSLTTKYLR